MLKVAVIGPESTGKSTLCEALSQHFGIPYIPECSRPYLSGLSRPYLFEDLTEIARCQLEEIQKASERPSKLVLSDTDILCVIVWSEVKYGHVSPELQSLYDQQRFDLYLLCDTSLPWVFDPLREVPDQHKREEIFSRFENKLLEQGLSYEIIGGQEEARIKNAIECLNRRLLS